MFIKSIRIVNFRSFEDSKEIPFDQMTTFLGPNGGGKSTVLQAIKFFYDVNAKITVEDFHDRNTSEPISISIVFETLTRDELVWFDKFVREQTLSVEKRFVIQDGRGKYFGKLKQHAGFQSIRDLSGREKINAYRKLTQHDDKLYSLLPLATSQGAVDQAILDWENSHPDQIDWVVSEVQFFGPRNIGGGSLDNFTRFVLVPAVRDAMLDSTDTKGSALGELLDILIKEVLMQKEELVNFRRRAADEFRALTDPSKLPEIPALETRLTSRLQELVPGTAVHLTTGQMREPTFILPETYVELTEDRFRGRIEGKGHGLQRSFMISMLQELAIIQAQRDEQVRRAEKESVETDHAPLTGEQRVANDFYPDLILAIEEPELYQHPVRQRHFEEILTALSAPGKDETRPRVQVVITTHSPYFVSVRRFNEIRMVAKQDDGSANVFSRVTIGDPVRACGIFCAARGIKEPNVKTFLAGLKNVVDSRVSEGFFGNCVVIVEGADDLVAIEASLLSNHINHKRLGIPICVAHGKCNIARIKTVLEALAIRTFTIFDCDGHRTNEKDLAHNEKENNALLNLCDWNPPDRTTFPTEAIVKERFACFPEELGRTLTAELNGYDFLARRDEIAATLGIEVKNPVVYETIFSECEAQGIRSKTLDSIAAAIAKLTGARIND